MSTGLPRPGLAGSSHRGRMKLLRGYISKSSAALNPLTITHLACELSMHRSRTALLGPSHQFAVRMRIIGIIVPRIRTHVSLAYSQRPAPRVSTLVPFISCSFYAIPIYPPFNLQIFLFTCIISCNCCEISRAAKLNNGSRSAGCSFFI